jgi:predicted dehydrogenase
LVHPDQAAEEIALPDALASEFDGGKPYVQQMLQVFAEQPVGDRLFIDAILGTASAQPTFYDGYKAMQVVDAALESAETGRCISLDDG